MRRFLIFLVGGLFVFFLSTSAWGLSLVGDGTLGDFEANLSFNGGILTIDLTNTSPEDNGGYITAFAFNTPRRLPDASGFLSTDPDFNLLKGPVKAPPFGNFDIGVGLDKKQKSWTGGGKPSFGIAVGETEKFTFDFNRPTPIFQILSDKIKKNKKPKKNDKTFENLQNLASVVFPLELDEKSLLDCVTGNDCFFVARFKGFECDGSDKVPGKPVPEPATMLLVGAGLIGLAGFRRKFKKS